MTERGYRNIANLLMLVGLFCLIYFLGTSLPFVIIGFIAIAIGILVQAFIEK